MRKYIGHTLAELAETTSFNSAGWQIRLLDGTDDIGEKVAKDITLLHILRKRPGLAVAEVVQACDSCGEIVLRVRYPRTEKETARKVKIYIAGKINGDPDYRAKFKRAREQVEQQGHVALTPDILPTGMMQQDYMRICLAMIDSADVVVFLPDWKDSKGAQLERQYCEYTGKKFLHI